ncbi:MAG: glutamine synthetase, partial [Pseudomonadota bacterium]|nr:glutamine synthetase [Pseudomonadota bacterium]
VPLEVLAADAKLFCTVREASEALDSDRDPRKKGRVMDDDQNDGYLELKWEEVYRFEHTPHPVEFDMYYSV